MLFLPPQESSCQMFTFRKESYGNVQDTSAFLSALNVIGQ